jgi:hypothetical protein
MLLRGLGGALVLPFLPSLHGESQAQVPSMPKRFVYVSISNGEQPENWWPTHNFDFSDLGDSVRAAPLASVAGQGGINRVLGPEFDPFLEKLIFLRGLSLIGPAVGGHVPAAALNGWRDGSSEPTIDQLLANSSAVYPTPPAVRSIHMMTKMGYQAEAGLSIGTDNSNIYADASPSVSWQRLFGTFVPDDPAAQIRHNLEMGVLDRVRGQYERLVNHPRISKSDRERLVSHAELIHDLEQRLGAGGPSCSPPGEPLDPSNDDDAGLAEITDLNIQLLTAGLACDRTRVAVLQLCVGTDLRFNHHGVSHDSKDNPVGAAELAAIHNDYAKQLAQLLGALDSVVEDPTTGTTLLDNTLVMFGNEDGVCWDVHEGGAMPVLLAGGSAHLNTGRYIDYRQQPFQQFVHPAYGSMNPDMIDYRGRLYNSLLLSVLEYMGEPIPANGIGDYRENNGQFDDAEAIQPLPFLA